MTADRAQGPALPADTAPPPITPSMPPAGLRHYLFALVLAVLLPAVAFGAVASWEALRSRDRALEGRLVDTAQALRSAMDSRIDGQLSALEVLGAADSLQDPVDLPGFRRLSARTAAAFGGWVTLMDTEGRVLMHTGLPEGDSLPGPGGATGQGGGGRWVRQVVEQRRPLVTDAATGRVSGRFVPVVLAPVLRDGVVWRIIGMPLEPQRLSTLLAGQATTGAGAAALTDGQGLIVAHSRNPALIGQQRPPRSDAGPSGQAGVLRGRSLADGQAIRTAYVRLTRAPAWMVWVNEPESTFAAARRDILLALAGGALLALAFGLGLAGGLARRILRPVQALVDHAETVAVMATGPFPADGPAPAATSLPPAELREFERLRRAVAAAEAALRQSRDQFRRVQEIGRVGGFLVDLRSGANQRALDYVDLYGATPAAEEATHEAWLQRLHPADRDRAERYFRAVVADGRPETHYGQEYRIRDPDGAIRWIAARAEIERDSAGRALRMIGAHVDITALKTAEAALRDSEEMLRLALEAADLGAWEIDLRHGRARRTGRTLEIFGVGSEAELGRFPAWRDRVHPEDLARLNAAVEEVRCGRAERYQVSYRFRRPDGQLRWVESHGRAAERDAEGQAVRLIGTTQDVTARREAQDRQALLAREVDHRAKNALAVVQAALRLTPRADPAAFAATIEGRVTALARAHSLLAEGRWSGAELRAVLAGELATFLAAPGQGGARATLQGPAVALSPAAVQALSLAFHEMATNAAKYGALALPDGHLEIAWTLDEAERLLHIAWTETGRVGQGGAPPATDASAPPATDASAPPATDASAPPATDASAPPATDPSAPPATDASAPPAMHASAPPARRGFGSQLIEATILRQLGGRLEQGWTAEGLRWQAWLPLARILPEGFGDDTPD
ncbi:PAS domain-containing protein [Falsiroseomonas selenitidurans]|uniref:histidine kinase n=1 Tax=Falsiroseomonas selenitidurans TaxID=2716335 RepID=A0ABX1E7I1_9PROT|nr:PAS domain-containing protein [Falsiroseomonas selenitidurans]NKC32886.1 PAS domain-containing protein [Falsiroseomonas selenitidurans]